mmetsp:Transcript_102982/g.174473  ORF Transcript_102982/g.174473 Transcript_102982/m.174473 type:complete len:111 (+) Transcript_102982:288-620(+)
MATQGGNSSNPNSSNPEHCVVKAHQMCGEHVAGDQYVTCVLRALDTTVKRLRPQMQQPSAFNDVTNDLPHTQQHDLKQKPSRLEPAYCSQRSNLHRSVFQQMAFYTFAKI